MTGTVAAASVWHNLLHTLNRSFTLQGRGRVGSRERSKASQARGDRVAASARQGGPLRLLLRFVPQGAVPATRQEAPRHPATLAPDARQALHLLPTAQQSDCETTKERRCQERVQRAHRAHALQGRRAHRSRRSQRRQETQARQAIRRKRLLAVRTVTSVLRCSHYFGPV